LNLSGAFEIAEENNQNLKIATQEIETASRSRLLSRSTLYPQLFAAAQGQAVKIPGLEGIIPDSAGSAGLRLNQVVYDDRKVSDFKASGRLLDSTREARELQRMDVLGETGRAYYRYLLERTLFRVQSDNLRLTRQNLQLAQVRVEAGFSGRDEVFRWESEVAKRTSELILQEAEIESARVALNQIFGIDQETRWAPEPQEVDPEVFPLADGGLDPYLDSMASMARLRDALVVIALEDSPELRVLREQMAALDIQYRQRKRLRYVPVFNLAANWNYDFYRSPQLPGVDKDSYTVGVYGAYPIFQGGARKHEIERVASDVVRLQEQIELTRQIVERRTRTALQRVGSSFPVIRLSKMASESARKNFVVVQDKYTQGLVNVTDLLEAQNETFVTDQAASASNYIFLQDLIELQRSISWFEDEKNPQEKVEFVLRIHQTVERTSGGTPAPGRE
jgi:outer membrane protein TolC